jgi:hypothetical protein
MGDLEAEYIREMYETEQEERKTPERRNIRLS